MTLIPADLFTELFDEEVPVALDAYDGSRAVRSDAVGTLEIRTPRAVRYLVTAPGELGLARAYAMGDIDVRGDLHATLHSLLVHRRGAPGWRDVAPLPRRSSRPHGPAVPCATHERATRALLTLAPRLIGRAGPGNALRPRGRPVTQPGRPITPRP
jgi:hypothetical protein